MSSSALHNASPKPTAPLLISVRFNDIPDLLLEVSNATNTSVAAFKQLIRADLNDLSAKNKLRLIHNGKLLKDEDILSAVLKVPTAPPRAPDPKGKGKAVEPAAPRVYINCAIGDVLTEEELEAERKIATSASIGESKHGKIAGQDAIHTTTTPVPRGFDRLLAGGFTQAEVNQLRLQFLSIQANIHTPDTMPPQETLRQMEDAWIDDNAGGAGRAGGSGFDFGDDGLGGGALDDLFWGNIMGFLWPLGCIVWACREEGIWSKRRKVAVFTGFMLSLTFGGLRVIG
jgi:hypothetical protein